jgi:hypothetical protein
MQKTVMNYTTGPVEEKEPEVIPQQNLFSEIVDYTPLEKSMKNARIWLYVIAGFQLIMGIAEYLNTEDKFIAWIAFGIDTGIGAVFLLLALWSRKKPTIAFTIALVLYVIVNLGFMFMDTNNIYKGILIKVLIVIALVKANKNARKYEAIKHSLGEEI